MDHAATDLSLDINQAVADWPGWVHDAIELASDGLLMLLAVVLSVVAARSLALTRCDRRARRRAVAVALVAGASVVAAYLASELLKIVVEQARPCQELDGAVALGGSCPPAGDFSFPSNHATIAAALATATALIAPRTAPFVALLALVAAGCRVALGVHYPHDVTAGLLLGAVVVALGVLVLRDPATRAVDALGRRRAASR